MHQLQAVEVAEDDNTATIGGGALSTNVTEGLWAAGKQTGESLTNGRAGEVWLLKQHSDRSV